MNYLPCLLDLDDNFVRSFRWKALIPQKLRAHAMAFEDTGATSWPAAQFDTVHGRHITVKRNPSTMPVELVDISAIRVVPISDGAMPEGFYMGRKHSWRIDASFITVMVIMSKDEPQVLEVHEPGRARISHPREWLFIGRVIGLREASFSYRRAAEAWARGEFAGGA